MFEQFLALKQSLFEPKHLAALLARFLLRLLQDAVRLFSRFERGFTQKRLALPFKLGALLVGIRSPTPLRLRRRNSVPPS
jgi:hypothetical protein